jgi:hypothetical protein
MSRVKILPNLRNWHWGKIVIVWAWGGMLVIALLRVFLTTPAAEKPGLAASTLIAALIVLIALSSITWMWLSGKESNRSSAPRDT